jgi:hypothetical protein
VVTLFFKVRIIDYPAVGGSPAGTLILEFPNPSPEISAGAMDIGEMPIADLFERTQRRRTITRANNTNPTTPTTIAPITPADSDEPLDETTVDLKLAEKEGELPLVVDMVMLVVMVEF